MAGTAGHSGGARSGKPGATYGNRTDLNASPQRTAPGTASAGQSTAAPAAPQPGPPPPMPGSPTGRPGEHVMTGAPMGQGAGPREIGVVPAGGGTGDDTLEMLKAILLAHPNEDLRDLVDGIQVGEYKPGGQFGPPLFGQQ